jgi:hypothetical protein
MTAMTIPLCRLAPIGGRPWRTHYVRVCRRHKIKSVDEEIRQWFDEMALA